MAIRNFTLSGKTYAEEVVCTITIGGIECFSGTLLIAEVVDNQPICVGSVEVGDDSQNIVLPVSITINSAPDGIAAGIGMFEWNYGEITNPALTPEEAAYATVPFEEIPAEIRASVNSKGGFLVRSADEYAYGLTADECRTNRANVQINGVSVENPPYWYQYVTTGQVLTFDQDIFARSDTTPT